MNRPYEGMGDPPAGRGAIRELPRHMAYDPQIHHRRSIRLGGYDYSRPGAYFVTLCTHQKEHLFGLIVEGEMHPNGYAEVVRLCWQHLPTRYPGVELGWFVLMPNHLHGIIKITDPQTGRFMNRPYNGETCCWPKSLAT